MLKFSISCQNAINLTLWIVTSTNDLNLMFKQPINLQSRSRELINCNEIGQINRNERTQGWQYKRLMCNLDDVFGGGCASGGRAGCLLTRWWVVQSLSPAVYMALNYICWLFHWCVNVWVSMKPPWYQVKKKKLIRSLSLTNHSLSLTNCALRLTKLFPQFN